MSCCSTDFAETKRMLGRPAASQIASASLASFLLDFTNGFTNCGAISRTADTGQRTTSMGGPHPDPDETPGDGWANPRARAWRARAAPCAPAPMPCLAQTEQYAVSRPGDLLPVDTLDVRFQA